MPYLSCTKHQIAKRVMSRLELTVEEVRFSVTTISVCFFPCSAYVLSSIGHAVGPPMFGHLHYDI